MVFVWKKNPALFFYPIGWKRNFLRDRCSAGKRASEVAPSSLPTAAGLVLQRPACWRLESSTRPEPARAWAVFLSPPRRGQVGSFFSAFLGW